MTLQNILFDDKINAMSSDRPSRERNDAESWNELKNKTNAIIDLLNNLSNKIVCCRIGNKHQQVVNINNSNIVTGHNLLAYPNMKLYISFKDQASAHAWQSAELDVDLMLERYNANAAQDYSITIYDNDYIKVSIVDPNNGTLKFVDVGRAFSYLSSEMIAPLPITQIIS